MDISRTGISRINPFTGKKHVKDLWEDLKKRIWDYTSPTLPKTCVK
jgi:hypothetical protein